MCHVKTSSCPDVYKQTDFMCVILYVYPRPYPRPSLPLLFNKHKVVLLYFECQKVGFIVYLVETKRLDLMTCETKVIDA